MKLKFGVILGDMYPAYRAVQCGIMAEKYGFDSVFVPDHIVDINGARIDCWTVLAAIGAQTNTVLLSPGVADVHHIHPAKMAQVVATLDELTLGRAIVALGAGEAMNLVPFGIDFGEARERIKQLEEYVDVMKLLWTSNRDRMAFYEGDFYKLKEAFIDQKWVQKPHPPIYIGVMRSQRLLKLVGKKANGWLSWVVLPERFTKFVKVIEDSAKGAGRNPEEIDKVVWLYMCMSQDVEVQKRAIEVGKAYLYVEGSILKEHGYRVPTPDYTHLLAHKPFPNGEALLNAARGVPEELVKKAIMIGSPDECIEHISKYVKAGAKHFGFRIMTVSGGPSIEDTIREISKIIMPYFKED